MELTNCSSTFFFFFLDFPTFLKTKQNSQACTIKEFQEKNEVITNSFPLTATCLRSWSKEALVFVFKSASSAEIKQTHGMLTVTNSIYFLNFRTYHKILISWIAKHVQQFCSRVYEISLWLKKPAKIYIVFNTGDDSRYLHNTDSSSAFCFLDLLLFE